VPAGWLQPGRQRGEVVGVGVMVGVRVDDDVTDGVCEGEPVVDGVMLGELVALGVTPRRSASQHTYGNLASHGMSFSVPMPAPKPMMQSSPVE
jgi:hypothetical protein